MSSQETPAKRRRWLRFSLRSFLLILTIGCLLLGYWVDQAEKQKAVVKWIHDHQGVVGYDTKFNEWGNRLPSADSPYPQWMLDVLGIDDFRTANYVLLNHNRELEDIAPVAQLHSLEVLKIQNTGVTDLTPVAKMANLEAFYITHTPASDLTPLAECEHLEVLFADHTKVSDLTPLAELKRLEYVSLGNTEVSDLSPLAHHTQLKQLYLDNTKVTDLKPLHTRKRLECVTLLDTDVTANERTALQQALPKCRIPWFPRIAVPRDDLTYKSSD